MCAGGGEKERPQAALPRFLRSMQAATSGRARDKVSRHVKQANEGCDFDFLEGTAPTAEPEIH